MARTNRITRSQIKSLRREAVEAGDSAQVELCDLALSADRESPEVEWAMAECASVLAAVDAALAEVQS